MEAAIIAAFVLAVLIPVLFLLPGVTAERDRARTRARLAVIDRKLDALLQHLEIDIPSDDHPDVVRHLTDGRKIHAIKAYRERTGASLADAKAEVERIARERGL